MKTKKGLPLQRLSLSPRTPRQRIKTETKQEKGNALGATGPLARPSPHPLVLLGPRHLLLAPQLLRPVLALLDLLARLVGGRLSQAVPDEPVLGLELLGGVDGVVDQAEAGRLAATELRERERREEGGDERGGVVERAGRGRSRRVPSPSPVRPLFYYAASPPTHRRAEAEDEDLLGVLDVVYLEWKGSGERDVSAAEGEKSRAAGARPPPSLLNRLRPPRPVHLSRRPPQARPATRTFWSFSWISALGTLGRPGWRTSTI